MSSIFTKIINREIQGHIIAEDANFIAFLDVSPLVAGHTLVVPKEEVDYIFDLEDETLSALNIFAKKVSKAVKEAIPCKRVGVAVIGLEVPHTHVHLVPLNTMDDINFTRPKLSPSKEELAEVASKIKAKLQ
jgi:histidine triad (HIT) family protein